MLTLLCVIVSASLLFVQLMETLRLSPVYPEDPMLGSAPIAYRWTVARQPAFHNCVELLRQRFPDVSEFG